MQNRQIEPLHWPAPECCQIIDLQSEHYDSVLHLIKHHYFLDDPMCRAINFQNDDLSLKNYLDLIRVWMRDTMSLVAISSRSGRVVGTVIARINSKIDKNITYSRIQIHHGESLESVMHLKNTLVKRADVFSQLNSDRIFRIFILCIHPSYKNQHVDSALLKACMDVANASDIPAIAGMFTSNTYQKLAEKVGFTKLSEIYYSQWIVDNEIVFDNPGIGNYSVAFMGMNTPSPDYLRNLREVEKEEFYEEYEQ